MQSDYITWGMAILLSLLIHSMMFVQRGAQIGAESAPELQATQITRLSFNQPADTPVLNEPRQTDTQPSAPVPAIPVKKVKTEPTQTKLAENIEPVRQLASLPQVHGEEVSQSSEGLLQRKRQQYLHRLLGHIESYKFYPRVARRRSIEGDVKISFTLRGDGYYEKLMLDGSQTTLVEATRQALELSKPLPAPPEDIGLSRQIELTMVYSLTR